MIKDKFKQIMKQEMVVNHEAADVIDACYDALSAFIPCWAPWISPP